MRTLDCHMTLEVIVMARCCSTSCACRIGSSRCFFRKRLAHHCSRRDIRRVDSACLPLYDPVAATYVLAAPGKFEAKKFCSKKRISTRCYVTYFCIFVVLYMKEPSHANSSAPLFR